MSVHHKIFVPRGIDRTEQYEKAVKAADSGDQLEYHMHEERECSEFEEKRTQAVCWTTE